MKKRFFLSVILCLLSLVWSGGAVAQDEEPKAVHRFLRAGGNSIAIVNEMGDTEWEYLLEPMQEVYDAWLLSNGNVFFSFKEGAREITVDKKKREVKADKDKGKSIVWEYSASKRAEVYGVQPLSDGLYLIAESFPNGQTKIYEMTNKKEIKKTVSIKLSGLAHEQARMVRKTALNTYLATQQRYGGDAMEFNEKGEWLRTMPGGRYAAVRLPNGNTVVACGDAHRVYEIDFWDKVVWEVKKDEIPGNPLGFVAGVQRLPNGNTIICNVPELNAAKNQPLAFEITPQKKVVWEADGATEMVKKIMSIQILDEKFQKAPYGPLR
ncbi:TPA: hypothetical protein DDW35_07495 [Candidatus Sumerlaeota bacterium]|nr:hypothetical protein [Candidatus Sumerlaeota bacterium]